MKVWNLACGAGHAFEGWFASEQAWVDQTARGLVTCPVCGAADVQKRPSAPRLNLSAARERVPSLQTAPASRQAVPVEPPKAPAPSLAPDLEALWHEIAQAVVSQTEDVGGQFAEEARRIHYGEAPERGIRGEASAEQRAELADEGIPVFSLPLSEGLKGPRH